MKKIVLITLVILSVVAYALVFFDSAKVQSTNNEGLKKPEVAVKGTFR